MQSRNVCPFLRKDDDICDVGHGYISPSDVKMMVSFCNCRYSECAKFQELAERYPARAAYAQPTPRQPLFRPAPQAAATLATAAGPSPGPPEVAPFKVKWPLPYHVSFLTSQYKENPNPLKEASMATQTAVKNKGWTVALAGLGVNLALGILYAYSMLKGDIAKLFDGAGDPYAFACLSFALSMIVGGKLQDKAGPRLTAILGGLLVGAGFLVCSQTSSYWGWVLGFGVLAGFGFGFGYSAATPPALKWFPSAKTGLIAGIVVAGFGIAPVYLAPLAKYLLASYGLHSTMMILGIAFIAIVCGMAMFISNPPAGFTAEEGGATAAKKSSVADKTPMEILREGRFYTLWTTYFIGAGAGLMVIGSIAGLAKKSMGEMAFIAVIMMSIGNAAGRVVAGVLSDKIGRANTLLIMLVFQAALMFAGISVVGGESANAILVTLLASFIGFNYGTNLSLFPSFAKDYWGSKNYGLNYGILFSAWGVGAFVLVKASAALSAKFGGFTVPLAVAGTMLLVGAMLSLSLRPKKAAVAVEVPATAGLEEEDLAFQRAND
ncbi:OFA family MFS transporter [Desulfuromonas sp.]|uniref:L-lactate MFS transporter n=1 Tax=Desulfuromonas sp. TaxID=892 RepID=UPI0025BD7067|nr:OFA family MFS transporter [Desulfuromonas sp.]